MTASPRTLTALLAFAVIAGVLLYLRPLMPIDETRYVAVAYEMWQSGDYLVPTKNFDLYTHKPPLLFWTMNAFWGVFGLSEIAARAVGPAFAVLAMFLTGRLANQLWPMDRGISGRAVWALAGIFVFVLFGSTTMFDAALTVAVLLGVMATEAALRTGKKKYWLGLGAALALGAVAKGPVILVHLVPIVLLTPLWARDLEDFAPKRIAKGFGIAFVFGLALVCLWLVPAILTGGAEYRDAILWKQSAGRIASSFAHARPIWWFVALLPMFLFPWVFVPQIWRAAFKARWSETGLRLALVWSISALVLFSLISGKQVHYLVPELPAVALVVARLTGGLTLTRLWAPAAAFALLAVAMVLAGLGVVDPGVVTDLLDPPLALLAVGLMLLAICGIALSLGDMRSGAVLSLGLLLCLGLVLRFTDMYASYDTNRLGALIAPHLDDGVAVYGHTYNAEFNFASRAETQIATPEDMPALDAWMAAHPEGVVVGRVDRSELAYAARDIVIFRDRPYGVWHVADAPMKDIPDANDS